VGGRFNPPVRADRLGRPLGDDRLARDIERGFAGAAQQPGSGGAGVNETLNPNDGADMRLPLAACERFAGVEDGDSAAFKSAAAPLIVMTDRDRGRLGDDAGDGLFKRWLVGLDLNDQGDAGLSGGFEMFF
jgi:hypothetical protein